MAQLKEPRFFWWGTGTLAWYIASFRDRTVATAHLHQQGFGTWCPSIPEDVYHHGRVHRINRPLFGHYLLVNFEITEDPWWRINNTPGVKRLLPMNEPNPRPVPTDFIDLMMEREAENLLTPTEFLDLARGYSPGDWLDISRGTYSGQGGHFLRPDYRKGLIIVLLRICNRPLSVSIPPYCVERKPMVLTRPQRKRS